MERTSPTQVRWAILGLLFGFSFVSYLQRTNISIAAQLMMPDLGLSQVAMGQLFSAFLIGYAIFQLPGGIFGDKFGPRLTLALAAFSWGACTLLTGALPGRLINGAGIFISLWILRFLLGMAEAVTYPVCALAVRNWMPLPQRGFGNAFMLNGAGVATAVAGPLVSWVMARLGWRASFYVTSSFAFLIAVVWYWYATDSPKDHRSVNASELAMIEGENGPAVVTSNERFGFRDVFSDRRILFLTLSYVSEGYVLFMFVFWLYIYLVQVRGFTLVAGGLVASVPFLVAAVATPLGGKVCDWLTLRRGYLSAGKIVIGASYGLCGVLLFAAAKASNRTLAVTVLSISVGCVFFAEPAFWATLLRFSGKRAGTVGGFMNTAGIAGGVVSTSLVPVIVKHFGWLAALGSGSLMAVLCTVLWFTCFRDDGHISAQSVAAD